MKRLIYERSLLLIAMMLVALHVDGQQQQQEVRELAPVSRTFAITNATITQAPGRKLERGTVVVKDGLIVAVGKNISIPPEAIVIKGDSLYVYAGFIDGLSRTGVPKPKEEPNQQRERPKDPGNPAPELAGITPQNDVRTTLNPSDKTVEDLRALGFTVAQVVPYGGMLPGAASIVLLSGKNPDEMVLFPKSALYGELAPAQRMYPNTVIGVMAKYRELYRQAALAKNHEALYASNRAGINRPSTNRILEAFYPVIDRRQPMLFEADRYLDLTRVLALQSEFGWALVAGDLKEGWEAIPKLKSSGTKVFLSLDLPDDKSFEAKSDKKKDEKSAEKSDSVGKSTPEMKALETRKNESIRLYTSQASTFHKAGITFGFSALSAKTSDIPKNLRRMIAAGLPEDQALAALTTSPAQLLGLSDRLGTIDNGKIANLVLTDKPYFSEKAKVRYVFVDGQMFKYDPKETPKADATVVVDISGTWSVVTQTNDSPAEEKVTFTKEGNTWSGSISGGRFEQAASLENVELNGMRLKFSYTTQAEGQSVKVDVDVTIEGNTFRGSASGGRFGPFNVEGKKDPNNKN